jgi:hypothetical protein
MILAPSEAIPRVAQRGRLATALAVVLLSRAIMLAAGIAAARPLSGAQTQQLDPGDVLLFSALQSLFSWVVGTVLLYLGARMLGGESRLLPLLVVTGYAHILFVPLTLVGLAAELAHAPRAVWGALGAAALAWIGLLAYLAAKEMFKLSPGRALGAVLLAAAMVILLSALARRPAGTPAQKQQQPPPVGARFPGRAGLPGPPKALAPLP